MYCRNLQLTVKWLWRVNLRSRESCTLGIQVPIGFWRGVLSLPTSWTSYGILVLISFSAGMSHFCMLPVHVPCSSFCRLLMIHHRNPFTSTTLVQKWYANVGSSTSSMARLRWFVRGDSSVRLGHTCYLYQYIHQRWMPVSYTHLTLPTIYSV